MIIEEKIKIKSYSEEISIECELDSNTLGQVDLIIRQRYWDRSSAYIEIQDIPLQDIKRIGELLIKLAENKEMIENIEKIKKVELEKEIKRKELISKMTKEELDILGIKK